MDSDDIKSKAFPFVYDTKGETDLGKRSDKLKASLTNVFPNHNVNVFIFGKTCSRSNYSRGATLFMNDYGSNVNIVLS